MAPDPKRVTLVADELLGYTRTGGLGTATTFLAVALGRMGHRVELLYVGEPTAVPMLPDWARLYDGAGVKVRMLPRSGQKIEPAAVARARDTELALGADPPDVVITQDLAAPAYTALRMRQLGLAFEHTLFVVYCHGTRQWITDVARKVRVLPGALTISVLEQASVELADVVVSPSAYLLEWMKQQAWRLPSRSLVIPYLTRGAATGEPPPRAELGGGRVERLAFFGRLEERKGLRPFAAGLNALGGELLQDVELEFLGGATPAWSPERVTMLLSERTRESLRAISFETDRDQPEALARLSRSGTLAVMPSLEDNSPNAVYECLERGIPFVASGAGGTAELVAPDDRGRVFFEPTPEGVAEVLRRALSGADALRPARPAFDASTAYEAWARVVETQPQPPRGVTERPTVDVVVTRDGPANERSPCLSALEPQLDDAVTVSSETTRQAGLSAARSEWIVFLNDHDVPEDHFVEALVRAQAASGADVVTCSVGLGSGFQQFFLGEPRGLGVLSNCYGTVALIRRSLLSDEPNRGFAEREQDWPLFARLALEGAQIVSVPDVLVESPARPDDLQSDPSDALIVLQQFEQHLPHSARPLARLAAGLAAQSSAEPRPGRQAVPGLSRLFSRK
jgi:glycosyltransferase involved in cell wall biosynthesis